jgi:hypothetical protein
MRTLRLILVSAAAMFLTGCSSKPRDMRIVGRWEGVRHEAFNVEIVIDYDEDGTVKATTRTLGITVAGRGKYEFVDDHTIVQEITFKKGDDKRAVKERQKISFDESGMTQTDEHGNPVKYRKVSKGGKSRSRSFWADVERGYRKAEWDPGRLLDWLNGYAVRWLGLLVGVLGLLIVVDLGRILHQIRDLSDRLTRWEKGHAQATSSEDRSKQEKKV